MPRWSFTYIGECKCMQTSLIQSGNVPTDKTTRQVRKMKGNRGCYCHDIHGRNEMKKLTSRKLRACLSFNLETIYAIAANMIS